MTKAIALIFLVWAAVVTADDSFSFSPADLQKELGPFQECKGKKINIPQSEVSRGTPFVADCILSLTPVPFFPPPPAKLNKPCMGLCVSVKMGYINDGNRTYNYEGATRALYSTVNSTDPNQPPNDKDVIDVAAGALKKCGESQGPYPLVDECENAKKFDECIRKAAAEECAPPAAAAAGK